MWFEIPVNFQQGLTLLVDMTKRIEIGGLTGYAWMRLLGVSIIGFWVLQIFIRNLFKALGYDTRFLVVQSLEDILSESERAFEDAERGNRMSVADEIYYSQRDEI
jgi:hypothetical protein